MAAEQYLAIGAAIIAIAAGLGAWDMLETRFIAVFAEGGMNEPLPAPVPLWAIAAVAGLLAAWLTGHGRPLVWRAKVFAVVGATALVAWLPAIVLFLVGTAIVLSV